MTVPPLVPHVGSEGRKGYRVPLQQRFEAYLGVDRAKADRYRGSPIDVNRQHASSATYSTHNGKPRLVIEELVYPGRSTRFPAGKWGYVVHLGRREFLAEAHFGSTANPGLVQWRNDPRPTDPQSRRDPGPHWQTVLELDPEAGFPLDTMRPGDAASDIGCFLAPHQLNASAMQMLLGAVSTKASGTDPSPALVKPVWSFPKPGYVALVDPFDWAEAANTEYFTPQLTEWQIHALDPEAQARLTIAGVMKAWKANGNPAGITLLQEPEAYLGSYARDELSRRHPADDAAGYLSACLDSVEHEVAERACLDHPDAARQLKLRSGALQHWCVVLDNTSQSAVSRRFLVLLVQSQDRAPARFILEEGTALGFNDFFATARWGALGAMGVVKELVAIKIGLDALHTATQSLLELRIQHMFDRMGFASFFTTERATFEEILRPKNGARPAASTAAQRFALRRLADRLDPGPGHLPPPVSAADIERQATSAADSAREASLPRLGRMLIFAKVVFEVANISLNYSEMRRAGTIDSRSVASLAGAAVDFAAMLTDVAAFAKLARSMRPKLAEAGTGLGKMAPVLAIVSGALDCYEQVMRAQDAAGGRDYGKEMGHVISAVGAGMVAIGGVLSLAGLIWGEATVAGSSGGPWGAAIGAAGGLLLAGGTVVSAYLQLNAYQQYARHCFLGDQATASSPATLVWSPVPLPAPTAVQQLHVLTALLANFRLKATGDGGPMNGPGVNDRPLDLLEIHLGFCAPDAELQIEIEQRYSHLGHVFTAFMRMRLSAPGLTVDSRRSTMTPRLQDVRVERRAEDLTVSRVTVPIRPVSMTVASNSMLFENYPGRTQPARNIVRVRIGEAVRGGQGGGRLAAPLSGWLTVDTMRTQSASSADDNALNKL